MINLLAKDFKLIFAQKGDIKKKIISTILMVLALALVVVIEIFLFQVIMNKIKNFYQAPIAFLTLFLFVISVLMTIFSLFTANKLFFNKLDMEQLLAHPVSNFQIITSKLLFLFIFHVVTSFIFTYPLFVSYGITFYKIKRFYFITLFYPIISFFIEAGIALILVYPVRIITNFLKRHLIIQYVLSILAMLLLSYLYSQVLSVFISLVSNNLLTTIFSSEFINKLLSIKKFFIPSNFLVDILINNNSQYLLPLILLCVGVFSLGFIVSTISFKNYKNSMSNNTNLKKVHKVKILSVKKALIKKELTILFKDSGYLLSFTGLLIIQPFLLYLVVYALNTIFTNGTFAYYISLFPNFVNLMDILIIILFSLIINSGANSYISMEGKNVRLMKTIPVSLYTQLIIKVSIPLILSIISLFVSNLVLCITSQMSLINSLLSFLLTSSMLFIFSIISLFEEMKVARGKEKNTFMSSIYSYLLPFAYFAITLVLSYLKVSIILVYLIGFIVVALISLPYLINLKKKVARMFLDLEMVN